MENSFMHLIVCIDYGRPA